MLESGTVPISLPVGVLDAHLAMIARESANWLATGRSEDAGGCAGLGRPAGGAPSLHVGQAGWQQVQSGEVAGDLGLGPTSQRGHDRVWLAHLSGHDRDSGAG